MSTRPALRPGFGKEPPHLRPGTEGSYSGLSSTLPLAPHAWGPHIRARVVPPSPRPSGERTWRCTERGGVPGRRAPSPPQARTTREVRPPRWPRPGGLGTGRTGTGGHGTGPGTSLRAPPAHDSAESGAAGERGEGRCWCSALSRAESSKGNSTWWGRRPPGRSWVGLPGLTPATAPGLRARGLRRLRDGDARGRPHPACLSC